MERANNNNGPARRDPVRSIPLPAPTPSARLRRLRRVMSRSDQPTPAQQRVLQDAIASPLGIVTEPITAGFASNAWQRMLERMVNAGWMRPYVHGGYEITPAGREAAR